MQKLSGFAHQWFSTLAPTPVLLVARLALAAAATNPKPNASTFKVGALKPTK
jgi:hypothetical protein